MRHRAHDRQIVRDEEVGHAVALLQRREQTQHLLLDRDVQGRGRFVEQQQAGTQDGGTRNRDPLALAAGEFMRIAIERVLVHADLGQHRRHGRTSLRRTQTGLVQGQSFLDDLQDRSSRRQRVKRILEDDLQMAPLRAQCACRQVVQARLAETDDARGFRLRQAQQRQSERALARARFADDAQRLPAVQLQVDAGDGLETTLAEEAAGQREATGDALCVEQYRCRRIGRCDLALRPAVEQQAGIGMLRRFEQRGGGTLLDQPAFLHHGDAIGESAHERQIMRDQQHGHSSFPLQFVEQFDDAPLHGDVERGGRFVGNQQAR